MSCYQYDLFYSLLNGLCRVPVRVEEKLNSYYNSVWIQFFVIGKLKTILLFSDFLNEKFYLSGSDIRKVVIRRLTRVLFEWEVEKLSKKMLNVSEFWSYRKLSLLSQPPVAVNLEWSARMEIFYPLLSLFCCYLLLIYMWFHIKRAAHHIKKIFFKSWEQSSSHFNLTS